jgi:phosphopantothenoylcysteine decarboxylase/phosphopantothenate--cysteine ligase
MPEGKTIVLGVTGGIAAYKAVELASKLTQEGMKINTIMTNAATKLVSPLTFQAITGSPVFTEIFDSIASPQINHISLADTADMIVVAPATANTIAKIAGGVGDNLLCCTILASKAPVIIAPAMHTNMYDNPATQDNLARLEDRHFTIIKPASGRLASGIKGTGRIAEIENILDTIHQILGKNGDLTGKQIVITAGGTQEFIDPVRYITNRSSGKTGYSLAVAARDRGARVTLISTPCTLRKPAGIDILQVRTAEEMYCATKNKITRADVLIMAAAVSDYRPQTISAEKIKKKGSSITLKMEPTRDILNSIKGDFLRVGFAAESDHVIENAALKLKQKKLDLIVANDITSTSGGFEADDNTVTIIDSSGERTSLPLMPKREVAERILDKVAFLLAQREQVKKGESD